ncbi:MAG: hypothetical protein PHE89_05715 [Alphaproteobacteria bacterium]|nr:hypothetical protein [Alphaproteobacteria bacterium]
MSEILFEFVREGSLVKVSAIDVETKTEAIVVVPLGLTENQMKQHALNRLKYLLQKKRK